MSLSAAPIWQAVVHPIPSPYRPQSERMAIHPLSLSSCLHETVHTQGVYQPYVSFKRFRLITMLICIKLASLVLLVREKVLPP